MIERVLALLVTPVVIAVAIAGWWTVARRCWRGEPVLAWEVRRTAPWGLADVLAALLAMMVFSLAAGALLPGGLDPPSAGEAEPPGLAAILAGSAAYLAAMIAALGIVKLRTGASWRDLGFDLRRIGGDVKLGLIAFAMAAPVVYGIQLVLVEWLEFQYDQPLIDLLRASPGWSSVAVTVFAALVTAPLAEEVLFRLLLQGWLEKALASGRPAGEILLGTRPDRSAGDQSTAEQPTIDGALADNPYSPPTAASVRAAEVTGGAPISASPRLRLTAALAVGSALFALAHSSQGWAPTIPLFVFALGLGFLYQRTQRLLPSITMHFALNAFTTIVLLIEVFQGRE